MKKIFDTIDYKTMLTFNVVSIIITSICEIFAVNVLLTKGMQPDIERWKYIAILIGVVVISLLLLGSLASLVLFVVMKKKKK